MPTVCMKDYTAIVSPVSYPFGDHTGNALLQTTEVFSTDMSVNGVCYNTDDLPASESQILQILFVAPIPPSGNMIIDGTTYGSVGIQQLSKVGSSNGDGSTLTRVYINVMMLSPTSATSISGGDNLVWQGTKYFDGGDPNNPVTSNLNIPYWITIDNAQIPRNYRIGLLITVWGYASQYYVSSSWNSIGIVVNAQNKTTSFSLPIAIQGDF